MRTVLTRIYFIMLAVFISTVIGCGDSSQQVGSLPPADAEYSVDETELAQFLDMAFGLVDKEAALQLAKEDYDLQQLRLHLRMIRWEFGAPARAFEPPPLLWGQYQIPAQSLNVTPYLKSVFESIEAGEDPGKAKIAQLVLADAVYASILLSEDSFRDSNPGRLHCESTITQAALWRLGIQYACEEKEIRGNIGVMTLEEKEYLQEIVRSGVVRYPKQIP